MSNQNNKEKQQLLELLLTNKLSKDQIKQMLEIAKNSKKNISNNLDIPHGYKIIKVSGDGTCFYHSIVQAGNDVRHLKLSTMSSGYELRIELINELEKLKKTNLFIKLTNESSILKNSINISLKSAIRQVSDAIYLENNNMSKMHNGINANISKEDLNKMIDNIINNLRKRQWGGGPILKLISIIFGICVNYYNKTTKKFDLVKPDHIDCTEENTITIFYNGVNHYDALRFIGKN